MGRTALVQSCVPWSRQQLNSPAHSLLSCVPNRMQIILESAARPLCAMLQSSDKPGVEAAAWLMGYLATDPANGRPLIAMGAAPALVCICGLADSEVNSADVGGRILMGSSP